MASALHATRRFLFAAPVAPVSVPSEPLLSPGLAPFRPGVPPELVVAGVVGAPGGAFAPAVALLSSSSARRRLLVAMFYGNARPKSSKTRKRKFSRVCEFPGAETRGDGARTTVARGDVRAARSACEGPRGGAGERGGEGRVSGRESLARARRRARPIASGVFRTPACAERGARASIPRGKRSCEICVSSREACAREKALAADRATARARAKRPRRVRGGIRGRSHVPRRSNERTRGPRAPTTGRASLGSFSRPVASRESERGQTLRRRARWGARGQDPPGRDRQSARKHTRRAHPGKRGGSGRSRATPARALRGDVSRVVAFGVRSARCLRVTPDGNRAARRARRSRDVRTRETNVGDIPHDSGERKLARASASRTRARRRRSMQSDAHELGPHRDRTAALPR